MKSRTRALAKAILLLLPGIASAAPAVYNSGDILMGFRATAQPGSGGSYVVNLGPVAALRHATGAVTLNRGNIKADLEITFGTSWRSRTDLFWGVGGSPSAIEDVAGDPAVTLYGSKAQSAPGVAGTAWSLAGGGTRTSVATTMRGLQDAFSTYQQSSNSSKAVFQNDGDKSDWRSYMASGGDDPNTSGNRDFGAFVDIEAVPAATLSLFRLPNQAQGVYEGYFSISADGIVTFTPEASALTYASWAATNAPGQTEAQDYDNDGIPNGVEFFMGTPGNAFTASPAVTGGVITWPRASGRTVGSFGVQVSSDLGLTDPWHTPVPDAVVTAGAVSYTLPAGAGRIFVRLAVAP